MTNIVDSVSLSYSTTAVSKILLTVGALAFAVHVTLLWWFRFPPMQDYADWLLQANVLARYHNPDFDYSTWYKIVVSPVPNLGFILPTALLALLLPVETAGKVVLTLYLCFFVIAVHRYSRASQGTGVHWLMGILLLYNISFQNGNIGFLIGVCVLLMLIARDLNSTSPASATGIVGVVLLFFVHAIPAVIYLVYAIVRLTDRSASKEVRRDFALRGLTLVILAFVYLLTRPEAIPQPFSMGLGWRYRLSTLSKSFVASWAFPPYEFSMVQTTANVLMFALVVYLAVKALGDTDVRRNAHGRLALLVILCAIVVPRFFLGLGEATQRFSFIGFALLLGFSTPLKNPRTFFSLAICAMLVFVTAVRVKDYTVGSQLLEKRFTFLSDHIPPGQPILPLNDQLGSSNSSVGQFVPKGMNFIFQNNYLLLAGGYNPWTFRTGIVIPRVDLISTMDSLKRVRKGIGPEVFHGSDVPPSINWIVLDAGEKWADTVQIQFRPEFVFDVDSLISRKIRTTILRRITMP